MSTLGDLFSAPADSRAERSDRSSRSLKDMTGDRPAAAPSTNGLDGLFRGAPRSTTDTWPIPAGEVDAVELRRMVESAAPPSGEPVTLEHPESGFTTARRRGRSSRDWLAIVLAVLAVLAVVATGAVAVRAASLSSPTSDALRTLHQSETALVNELGAIDSNIAHLEAERTSGRALAEGLAAPLAGVADVEDGAAEAARVAYLAALDDLETPKRPPAYQQMELDTSSSIEQIADAIDEVTARYAVVVAASETVAAVATELAGLEESFTAAMRVFSKSVPMAASAILAVNPDADESLRSSTAETAAAVAAAPVDGLGAALIAYSQQISALQADQARALDVRARLDQTQETNQRSEGIVVPVVPAAPSDPVAVNPDIVDPAPVDPAPVNPTGPAEPSPSESTAPVDLAP